ncbi:MULTISPECIES: 50S ribosomal protein L29 [Flexistipes]|uniref:Large ribosomal subunit protein uL29 n=2 Tax=Flexistipes sinusarabici TaxID=2352 RepID=F8E9A7_FLESM|nr:MULTISPECIES: 50S ribosomal protein L29 [Flexistipes]AEI14159.1 ribosomal protein L29 [Flexistipes sinusarabici DSM 4947]MEC9491855.1 50S ribosomal protein L29 [Flexistipes sp.]HCW94062.1 50S ribosomal protein L29 [Flexistipes sinusarabici]
MKPSEIREMTANEIENKEKELREDLFRLKFKLATGELEDTSKIKLTRRDIARLKTILKEKKAEV